MMLHASHTSKVNASFGRGYSVCTTRPSSITVFKLYSCKFCPLDFVKQLIYYFGQLPQTHYSFGPGETGLYETRSFMFGQCDADYLFERDIQKTLLLYVRLSKSICPCVLA